MARHQQHVVGQRQTDGSRHASGPAAAAPRETSWRGATNRMQQGTHL
jgi:hypothetical protein